VATPAQQRAATTIAIYGRTGMGTAMRDDAGGNGAMSTVAAGTTASPDRPPGGQPREQRWN